MFHEKINRDEAAKLLLSQKIDTYTWPDTWFIRHDKISLDLRNRLLIIPVNNKLNVVVTIILRVLEIDFGYVTNVL